MSREPSPGCTVCSPKRVMVFPSDMKLAQAIPGLFECKEPERGLGAHTHLVFGEALRSAMDKQIGIDIDVIAALDWASGVAVRFRQRS